MAKLIIAYLSVCISGRLASHFLSSYLSDWLSVCLSVCSFICQNYRFKHLFPCVLIVLSRHFVTQEVIEVSKKHFPGIACGFDNPKLTVHNMDGAEFMSMKEETFDVIITDSSDPIGNYNICRVIYLLFLVCLL